MSTQGFNRLFAGYSNNGATRGTRDLVQKTIVDSLTLMQTAKGLIDRATQENERATLHVVIRMTNRVWVKLKGDIAPTAATEAVLAILNQAAAARQAWNGLDVQRGRNFLDRGAPHKATPAQFEAVKAAYITVVDELTKWLESVRPDE